MPRQSIRSLTFSVPAPIPLSEPVAEEEVVTAMVGEPVAGFIVPDGDYAAYIESHLAPIMHIEQDWIADRAARAAAEAEAVAAEQWQRQRPGGGLVVPGGGGMVHRPPGVQPGLRQ